MVRWIWHSLWRHFHGLRHPRTDTKEVRTSPEPDGPGAYEGLIDGALNIEQEIHEFELNVKYPLFLFPCY